jgi:apolipoprotein N-acyltransferase
VVRPAGIRRARVDRRRRARADARREAGSSWRRGTSSPSSPGACPFPASARRSGSHRASAGICELANVDPDALERELSAAGGAPARERPQSRATTYAQARLAAPAGALATAAEVRGVAAAARDPCVPAAPAHRLRQRFGEYYTFGLAAYLTTFGLWWAAWAIGVVLCAARPARAIELATLGVLLIRPARAIDARYWLDRVGLALLYIGVPSWLLLRVVAG